MDTTKPASLPVLEIRPQTRTPISANYKCVYMFSPLGLCRVCVCRASADQIAGKGRESQTAGARSGVRAGGAFIRLLSWCSLSRRCLSLYRCLQEQNVRLKTRIQELGSRRPTSSSSSSSQSKSTTASLERSRRIFLDSESEPDDEPIPTSKPKSLFRAKPKTRRLAP